MRNRRLWRRLFFAFLWAPAVVLGSLGWYASGVVGRLYENQLNGDLEARARLCAESFMPALIEAKSDATGTKLPLATAAGAAVKAGTNPSHLSPSNPLPKGKETHGIGTTGDFGDLDALCKKLGRSSGTRITVVLPTGRVVGDSAENPGNMDNHGGRPEILEALAGRVGRSRRYSSTEQEDRIYVAVPVKRGAETIAVVRTALPVAALTETLRIVRGRVAAAVLAGLLLHIAVAWAIARRMSRPLLQIKAGAERFAAGDLAHRLRVRDSLEMDSLAETLNRMAEQLEERIHTVLLQQNEREAMLSSMEEGMLAIDNEGVILNLNDACAAILGEPPERLRGRSIYEAVRKADLLAFMESALRGSSPVEGEMQLRGSQDRWLSAHGTPLHDPQRGKIGVLVVLHDVTRLRRLEEVRRDFVANVSHELRTPITSSKGFLETLLDGAIDDRENARRFLQIALRQVNRLDAIIGDLLMLSRIERGAEEQRIELAAEPIRKALLAAIEMCEKKAADKAVRVALECPEDLSGRINAALFEQAVVNLLDNAIKYSDSGASVEIRAFREGEEIVVEVRDQGCGIEAQHLPRLFERFYRVDRARSRELGGTGLGLAIVRHIALAHRGSVSVESTVGVGSMFRLRIPAEESHGIPQKI